MSLTAAAICGEAVVGCLCSVMRTANWSLYLPDKRYNEERGNKFSVFRENAKLFFILFYFLTVDSQPSLFPLAHSLYAKLS